MFLNHQSNIGRILTSVVQNLHIKLGNAPLFLLTKSKLLLETDSEVLQAVARAIALVQQQTGYGSIEITVHDGRVTQIERREKVRFEHKTIVSRT